MDLNCCSDLLQINLVFRDEYVYQQSYGHLKYPLARINYLSKHESIDEEREDFK